MNSVSENAWIQVYGGGKVHPLNVQPGEINITDIAHALSNKCRFNGHTREFYSVAEHSVRVAMLLPFTTGASLAGLLHDASEAYFDDIVSPMKCTPEYSLVRNADWLMQREIYRLFGVDEEKHKDAVHGADRILCATEARDLMSPIQPEWSVQMTLIPRLPGIIVPWSPHEAEAWFLKLFVSSMENKG